MQQLIQKNCAISPIPKNMESADSSTGVHHPQLPPGFRFHPTDEELVVHYLKRKLASTPLPVAIIAEVDLYKFDPWELPGKATFGDQEWYFFSPRDRKYPNGARPNRAATSGYWKATGTDKPIMTSNGGQKVGVKKALVFYGGKPPKGIKTNWIMHEYRLVDNNLNAAGSGFSTKKGSLRLDDWVLCRIYKKHVSAQRPMESDKEDSIEGNNNMTLLLANCGHHQNNIPKPPMGSKPTSYSSLLESDQENFFDGLLTQGGSRSGSRPGSGGDGMQNSSFTNSTGGNLPLKRAISSHHYWIGNEDIGHGGPPYSMSDSPAAKRFQGDLNNSGRSNGTNGEHDHNHQENSNGSFVSLLNNLPHQGSPFHHPNSLIGSLGDGVLRQQFQLPTINWNS